MRYDYDAVNRECEINGKKVPFNVCSHTEDEAAARQVWPYPRYIYLGKSIRYWIGGVLQKGNYAIHFFINNPNQKNVRFKTTK